MSFFNVSGHFSIETQQRIKMTKNTRVAVSFPVHALTLRVYNDGHCTVYPAEGIYFISMNVSKSFTVFPSLYCLCFYIENSIFDNCDVPGAIDACVYMYRTTHTQVHVSSQSAPCRSIYGSDIVSGR